MKIVVSHPTGNQFSRSFISALSKNDMLTEFHTTVAVDPAAFWLKLLPAKVKRECLRRSYPIPYNKIQKHPLVEIARIVAGQTHIRKYIKSEISWANVDAVYKDLDLKVAKRLEALSKGTRPDAIYSYEDCSEFSFNKAKEFDIKCLYDLPIGYWRTARLLLKKELERWPDWADTLTGFRDSEEKLARKDEELRLADKIFVASQFTAKTLNDFSGKLAPVKVIPYGFPPVIENRDYLIKISEGAPLKLLFVGGLSQRKGIADLFAAVKAFGKHVELTLVGKSAGNNCAVLNEELKKHRWIPSLPHAGVLKLMREHDVLVFPSLFEGFGLVITEAMAQGTPVITTDRTAGPDIIRDGENGWLIEAGSIEKLKLAIENILIHPYLIEKTGRAAIETASQRPWDVYGSELINAVMNNN